MAYPHRLGALCVDIEEFSWPKNVWSRTVHHRTCNDVGIRLHGTRASACLTGFGLAISLPSMLRFMETHRVRMDVASDIRSACL